MNRFKKQTVKTRCLRCSGRGKIYAWHTQGRDEAQCPSCMGSGWEYRTIEVLDQSYNRLAPSKGDALDQIVQNALQNLKASEKCLEDSGSELDVAFMSDGE